MATDAPPLQSTEFTTRRAALISQIGDSLEQVLQQMNGLNRSIEGIIEIGNEFASVEALWSQFETVMGNHQDGETTTAANDETENGDGDTTVQQGENKS